MLAFLTRDEEGPQVGEIETLARRDPFSKWLPYLAYDKDTECYHNSDNTKGYLWECSPVAFLSDKGADALAGILRQSFPEETIMSFTLYPDDNIDPILERFKSTKIRTDGVTQEAAARYAEYLGEGRAGMKSLASVRTRNFRLIVSLKSAEELPVERIAQVKEGLSAAGLAPRSMLPGQFINFLRRVFNTTLPMNPESYDNTRYIRSQVIQAETAIVPKGDTLWLGRVPAGCLTPKTLADFDGLTINELIGGFRGREDDATQLSHRFLWNTSVFFRTNASKVKSKASVMMAQKNGGSIAKEIGRRTSELSWVLDELESMPYCDVLTSFWVLGDAAKSDDESDIKASEKHLAEGLARARGLWEKHNFVMQREDRIASPMLIASLPFGLYTGGPKYKNIETLDRDFPVSVKAASRFLPVQADFAGHMEPALLMVGRKGQLASIDVFDTAANNHNFLICAGSGAGKSFYNNFLVSNYYGQGALMRLVDIGYSYQKQCLIRGGRFIDIGKEAGHLVLNPFQGVKENGQDSEDKSANRATVAQIIMAMVYSGTGTARVTETQLSLVKQAVDFAYSEDGGEYGIDHVSRFLKTYPKHAPAGSELEAVSELAHEMAFNLTDWTSKGRYGGMFNGPSTFDISSDEFVVLEMEQLLNDPELFGVVALQVLNAITQDLYLSDRSQRRFMLFDEAWKYLVSGSGDGSSAGSSATTAIASIIEEGYRRARKYGGATGIVTQSPLDLGKMGKAGEVIKGNSAFKFWLECDPEEWALAAKRDIVGYSGLAYDMAVSVKSCKPRYSEIFFDTPFGAGVGRLTVDPWSYWINTSDPKDFHIFATRMKELGGDALAALNDLAAR